MVTATKKKTGKPDSGVVRLTNKKPLKKAASHTAHAEEVVCASSEVKVDVKADVKEPTAKKAGGKTAVLVPSTVIYLGHLPDGFEENELRSYFTQFGKVVHVRLSRSLKTGKSRGYGWVKFNDHIVAKLAADTMNNYLFREKILKCEVVPRARLHARLFAGVTMAPRRQASSRYAAAARRHNRERSDGETQRRNEAIVDRIMEKNRRLKKLGVDYQFVPFLHGEPATTEPATPHASADDRQTTGRRRITDSSAVAESPLADTSLPAVYMATTDDELEFHTPPNTVKKRRKRAVTTSSGAKVDKALSTKARSTTVTPVSASQPEKSKKTGSSATKHTPTVTPVVPAAKADKAKRSGKKSRYFDALTTPESVAIEAPKASSTTGKRSSRKRNVTAYLG